MDIEAVIPAKSPNDQRSYEAIILPNHLKLLLVHDPDITKSACSISVGVGSSEDPDRSLGLAHFLEHMLFMGSEKFPLHNEYSSFISSNSGFDNAYTSDQETNYYFEIKNSCFNEAVERITNFFTGALLNKECIQKERQAVHQQYVLWTNDDNCRKWEVLRKLGSPPYSRFTIGNQETLNHEHIREDLVGFYNQRYSSNIINAVLCSDHSIEEMKNDLLKHFGCIENKNVSRPVLGEHFSNEQSGKLVLMESIKDENIMECFFVLQSLRTLYKKHISDYITHVIGHEGAHSLLSILKARQYASELSCYTHDLISQTLLGVELKLTEKGFENYCEVYNIVMDYMSSLKPEKAIFEQIKELKKIQFQFKEKTKVSNYVCQLSSKMHDIPLPEILNYSSLFEEFDEPLFAKVLSQINPFNVIIILSSNNSLEDPIQQKYLGANYKVQKLPDRKSSNIVFEPQLPNIFIPIDTTLLAKPEGQSLLVPTKLSDRISFLQDDSFRVCKGGIEIKVFTEEDVTFLQFYCNYLELLIKELTYPAEALDAKVEFDFDDCLIIKIFSFNDTVSKLVKQIGEEASKAHLSERSKNIFKIALDDLIEDYENFYSQEADEIAEAVRSNMLTEGTPSVEDSIAALNEYEYEAITKRISQFWEKSRFEWVVVGNFESEKISTLIHNMESQVRNGNPEVAGQKIGCLKINQSIRHAIQLQEEELSSSCCAVYYQVGPYTEKLYYMASLLKNHIDEPFFNELRTEKQMAYSLGVKVLNTRGILGLEFILVSSTRDPYDISQEIKGFAEGFFGKLDENLQQEKLEQVKDSLAIKLGAPHNNLKSKFDFISHEISDRTHYFLRKEKEELWKHLNSITLNDLKDLWAQIRVRTFDVLIASKNHQESFHGHKVQCVTEERIREKGQYWPEYGCQL